MKILRDIWYQLWYQFWDIRSRKPPFLYFFGCLFIILYSISANLIGEYLSIYRCDSDARTQMLVVNDFPKDWRAQSFTNQDTYHDGESRICIGTYIHQDKQAIQKIIKYTNKSDADRAFLVLKGVYFTGEYNLDYKLMSYIQHADQFDAACEKLDDVIKCTAMMQYGFSVVLFDSEISSRGITDIDFANIIKKIDEKYPK